METNNEKLKRYLETKLINLGFISNIKSHYNYRHSNKSIEIVMYTFSDYFTIFTTDSITQTNKDFIDVYYVDCNELTLNLLISQLRLEILSNYEFGLTK